MAPKSGEAPLPKSKGVSFAEADEEEVIAFRENDAGAAAATTTTGGAGGTSASTPPPPPPSKTPSRSSLDHNPSLATRESEVLRAAARESLAMLLEGNARFCSGKLERCRAPDADALADAASEDRASPSAVVLACSDARAPPELLFDAALGELHVVRVAGGAVRSATAARADGDGDVVLASVLDGVLRGGARCVVVLGHSRCDAARVAIEGWAAARKRSEAEAAAASAGDWGGRCCPSPSLQAAAAATATPSPFSSAAGTPSPTPVKAAAATQHHSKAKRGGFLARLFRAGGGGGAGATSNPPPEGSSAGGLGPRRRTSSLERHSASSSHHGGSSHGGGANNANDKNHNPLSAIADALSGAVDAVSRGVSGGSKFSKVASAFLRSAGGGGGEGAGGASGSSTPKGEGEDEDDDDGGDDGGDAATQRRKAALALRSQDSIGIAHARFAKARAAAACEEADAEGALDDVIDENVKRTVAVVLQALMRATDDATARSVEVVGARYDVSSGRVRVLRTGWVSARGGALYE